MPVLTCLEAPGQSIITIEDNIMSEVKPILFLDGIL